MSLKDKLQFVPDRLLVEELQRRGYTVKEPATPEPTPVTRTRRITAFTRMDSLNDTHTTEELERASESARKAKETFKSDDED